MEQLGVVDLEQHTGDLAGEVGIHPLDQREQSLTQHLLLLLGRSRGQHGGGQGLLAGDLHGLLGHGGGNHGLTGHSLHGRVPGGLGVLEAGLGSSDLGAAHGDWGHAGAGHHHGLGASWLHHLGPGGGRGSAHAGGAGSGGHPGAGHAHSGHLLGARGSSHAGLGGPSWLGADLGGSEEPLGLRHGGHEVSAHAHLLHASHALHPHAGHTLDVLGSQVSLAVLLPLGQGHVQRLGDDDAAIHLSDGLGGLLWGREANESESLGATLLAHNPGGGDGSIRSKLLSESLIVDGVIQILDIQVDALVSVEPLKLQLLKLLLELGLSLGLLLSPAHVEGLTPDLLAVQFINGLLSRLGVFE